MKIKFIGKFKSLSSFESEELSNFTVIVGKNGTGKSQLISCIEIRNATPEPINGFDLIFEPVFKAIKISDLIYKSSGPASASSFREKAQDYAMAFYSLQSHHKFLYTILIEKEIPLKDFINLNKLEIASLLNVPDFKKFSINIIFEKTHIKYDTVEMEEDTIFMLFKESLMNDVDFFDVLFTVAKHKNKNIEAFENNDFLTTPMQEKHIDTSDMFNSKVETVFFNYLKRRHDNDYLNYRNQKFGESNNVIEDTDFGELYPAPWVLMNKILAENKIPLSVKEYEIKGYSEDISIEVVFKKEGIKDFIPFNDLSGGEKVIIGLITKVFTEKYYLTDFVFPELIILDEPDAHLHPEMSKLLIEVLYKSFVLNLGINVIMTTHSPSTVALAPEDCIYEMANTPICSLKKISKDSALELLTGMIPTLSIDYKNHKQIFLESPTDVTYFQKLFDKLNIEKQLNFKLYFISNKKGDGNCNWVKDIVLKLREGEVNKAYGIIDWDGKNVGSQEVIVHGEKSRYSIENFLYDPIYLSILFLEKLNGANNIKAELHFDETYNQYNLIYESDNRLQEIWDWYVKKIETRFSTLKSEKSKEISYYNGRKVTAPQWFLDMQGHELEEKLRNVFSSLVKFSSEGELQNDLSIIMAKCYPLVPKESIELLEKLCL